MIKEPQDVMITFLTEEITEQLQAEIALEKRVWKRLKYLSVPINMALLDMISKMDYDMLCRYDTDLKWLCRDMHKNMMTLRACQAREIFGNEAWRNGQ